MKKIILTMGVILGITSISYASFDSMYQNFVERIASTSTSTNSVIEETTKQGHMLATDTTLKMNIYDANNLSVKATLTSNNLQSTTGSLFVSGSIGVAGSGTIEDYSGTLALGSDYYLNSNNVYFKLTQLDLPIEDKEFSIVKELFKDKWIQIPLSGEDIDMEQIEALLHKSTLQGQKELLHTITKNKIIQQYNESTQAYYRNGYEIYPIKLDPLAIKTVMTNINPELSGMDNNQAITNFNKAIRSYGVIGKKGDEIKMAMMMKERSILNPTTTILTYSSTGSQQQNFGVMVKEGKTRVMGMTADMKNNSNNNAQLSMILELEDVTIHVDLNSQYYDAGIIQTQEPKDTIQLQDLQQLMLD